MKTFSSDKHAWKRTQCDRSMLRFCCFMTLLRTFAASYCCSLPLLLLLWEYSLACPPTCQECSTTRVRCHGSGLAFIPQSLPHSTEAVYLGRNNIPRLSARDLKRLDNLSVLFLDNSGLVRVEPRSLTQLQKLHCLYLNDNHIQHLQPGTFQGLSGLSCLHLQHNKLVSLTKGIFTHLAALRSLHLQGNRLQDLGHAVFSDLTNLRSLNLANNRISALSSSVFAGLGNLEFLHLEENRLSQIPSGVFAALGNLKRLDLSLNPIGTVPSFAFRGLRRLQYLFMEGAGVTHVHHDGFADLDSLRQLTLSRNFLHSVHDESFCLLTHLRYLHLDRNDISHIGVDAFKGMSGSLRFLNLRENKLTSLHPDVLQPLLPLTQVQVAGNPWNCSCALLPLQIWLTTTSSIKMNIQCQFPLHLKGRFFNYVNIHELGKCPSPNASATTLGSVSLITRTEERLETTTPSPRSTTYRHQPQSARAIAVEQNSAREKLRAVETLQTTPVLPLQLPAQAPPRKVTLLSGERREGAQEPLSVKPTPMCEHRLARLNEAFNILLAFLVIACALLLALLYKVLALRHRLKMAGGRSVIEYFSFYHSSHYSVSEANRPPPLPQPLSLPAPVPHPQPLPLPPPPHHVTGADVPVYSRIGKTAPLKHYNGNRTQVILFEHSVL
ncbi:leucine-rich repeat-containing protein 70 [Amia ocellicauda]|uniref:leucine-rich repeat-containing protein 70 n=1 Tax=Amia ocellicauda TaxID=2972642 RepID=UPI003464A857